MGNEYYRQFIEEAFVRPIRSVLIVDDEYPTYDEILDSQSSLNRGERPDVHKTWHENPDQIKRVIKNFRQQNPSLLIDIHDGTDIDTNDEENAVKHLHQCDLLILDYQLDKTKQGDGESAIKVLCSLMANDHFNLVVVHTKGDLDKVFTTILWGLLNPSTDLLTPKDNDRARDLIDEGEDDFEGLESCLLESVGAEQYFYSRRHIATYPEAMREGNPPYSEFHTHATKPGWNQAEQELVLRHLFEKLERQHIGQRNMIPAADHLGWSSGPVRWIKSDSLFVAFSEKTDSEDLLSELLSALDDWCPKPSRLFLTKLRAEMDEYGIVAQSQALRNHRASAYWYERLLQTTDKEDQRWQVIENVSRHSEQLMSVVLPRVETFVENLIETEMVTGEDPTQICSNHFGVDLAESDIRKLSILEHNAFVCSKPPEGWHLTTGHIFIMGQDFWICLSPACDMVPSQTSGWRADIIGKRLPFIAVKLQEAPDSTIPKDVQTNRHIFLQINDETKTFCFNNPSSRLGDKSAPHWLVLYAENNGKFSGQERQFTVLRTEQGRTRLIAKPHEAQVIGQLRYEYAINLVQKLGTTLTRVGLDYASVPK